MCSGYCELEGGNYEFLSSFKFIERGIIMQVHCHNYAFRTLNNPLLLENTKKKNVKLKKFMAIFEYLFCILQILHFNNIDSFR